MPPTDDWAENRALELLPCSGEGDGLCIDDSHYHGCPGRYRPAVAAELGRLRRERDRALRVAWTYSQHDRDCNRVETGECDCGIHEEIQWVCKVLSAKGIDALSEVLADLGLADLDDEEASGADR